MDLAKYKDDGDKGPILEVDLEYPQELRGKNTTATHHRRSNSKCQTKCCFKKRIIANKYTAVKPILRSSTKAGTESNRQEQIRPSLLQPTTLSISRSQNKESP